VGADITLAALKHDEKWMRAFLQAPYTVDVQSPCQANLDEHAAGDVYRFLRDHARPTAGQSAATTLTSSSEGRHGRGAAAPIETSAPVGKTPPDAVHNDGADRGTPPGGVPPQSVSSVVPAPPPAPKRGMSHR